MFDWLRLFENTAFFVLLMIETLADIKDFMVLIMVSLLMFGLPMTILNNNRGELDSVQDAPIGFWIIDMIIGQYFLAYIIKTVENNLLSLLRRCLPPTSQRSDTSLTSEKVLFISYLP